jgi:hypothetical protein
MSLLLDKTGHLDGIQTPTLPEVPNPYGSTSGRVCCYVLRITHHALRSTNNLINPQQSATISGIVESHKILFISAEVDPFAKTGGLW